jgi:hypothetical protein
MKTLFQLPHPKRTLEARRVSIIKRLLRVAAILEAYDECADAPNLRTIKGIDSDELDVENTPDIYPNERLDRAMAKLEKWLRAIECCLLDRDPSAPDRPGHTTMFVCAEFTTDYGYTAVRDRNAYIAEHGKPAAALPAFKNCTVAEWLGTAKRKPFATLGERVQSIGMWRGKLCRFEEPRTYCDGSKAKLERSRAYIGPPFAKLGPHLTAWRAMWKTSADITFDPSTLAP